MQESQGESKTKNLAAEKAKRGVTVIDGDKPPKLAEVYAAMAHMVNHHAHSSLPKMAERFYTVELAEGVRQIATENADGSLRPVPESALVNAIQGHCARELPGRPVFTLTAAQASECVRTWMTLTAPLTEVPYTRWASEPGHCWRRIPFDLTPDLELTGTATWNQLLSKIENPKAIKALCAFIGAIFEPNAYRQQYVWIYGKGNNGKGCITRFLHRVMGLTSHFVSNVPKEPNQFWTSQFLNRRLIVVPDCANAAFPASGLFKTLSGDDPVTIERKRQDHYTATLCALFLFTSNELPALSSENADMRRALLVRMEGTATWEAGFEDRLWAEGGAFLWHCRRVYRELCPTYGPIPTDDAELKAWVATLEEEEGIIFARWFALDDNDDGVVPTDMDMLLRQEYARAPQRAAFRKWLERTHGVRNKSVRLKNGPKKGHVENRYAGVRLRRSPSPYTTPRQSD